MTIRATTLLAAIATFVFFANATEAEEYLNGIKWDKPAIVSPGASNVAPPSDATVLFGGKDLSSWNNAERWSVEDGDMIAGRGKIVSKESFGDCQLHIEWSAPTPPKGRGQGRGNSGVFFLDTYEIQVLDS